MRRRRRRVALSSGSNARNSAWSEASFALRFLAAYKKGDGAKIDGRRVVVDYERGRTQKQWLPRRLGGGKGDTRRTREPKNAARDDDRSNGGFRDDYSRSYSRDRDHRDSGGYRNGSSRHRSRSRERSSRSGGGGGDRHDRSSGGGDRRHDRYI